MILSLAFGAALLGPPGSIAVGDGFLIPTQYRTLARYQLAIGAEAEYAKLIRVARDNSRRRPPRQLRVLQIIVPSIDAPIEDKDGNKVRATSTMSSAEINRCREWFDGYCNLVFAYTGGAVRVEPTELLLEHTVTQLDQMGERKYWLSGQTAIRGIENKIRENYYDSIAFYYKKPDNMQAGLLGGALGRDYGVRGSAFWTQWITDWSELPSNFAGASVVSIHEWLHNITYYSHKVMGYTAVPDCHAAEEYGYWDCDGGYKQWHAWNRDLMLRLIPRELWYRLDTRAKELPSTSEPINKGLRPGNFFKWRDVSADWHARLPSLTDSDLRKLTSVEDLTLESFQPAANSPIVYRLATKTKLESSTYEGSLAEAPIKMDNVLALTRRRTASKREDIYGGYLDAPIEGMAILRGPNADQQRRDLVVIRPDLAPYVLPLLVVKGARASDSIVGYIHRQDPAESQQLTLIVALVNFGDRLPADELAAIGK